jgi:hypothetical protein
MYLIVAGTVDESDEYAYGTVVSDTYVYEFKPYLLSLPNNYYGAESNDDTWVYNVTTGLKPSRSDRLGDLVINKTFTTFNESLGQASVVFRVEAIKDDTVVLSDVYSLVFDTAGSKSIVIKDVPAGAQVTVQEIYNGASYSAVGASAQGAVVTAGTQTAVDFTNEYNEGLNSGSSIVNHFVYTQDENGSGIWDWQQQTDNADQAQ